jgi:hypothetical protein
MQGLYKKVINGRYQRIPVMYSTDLGTMINLLLQVSPTSRPTCDQILSNNLITKRHHLINEELLDNYQDNENI